MSSIEPTVHEVPWRSRLAAFVAMTYRTFEGSLDHLAGSSGRVTRRTFSGMSGSRVARIISGHVALGLITPQGERTERLHALLRAREAGDGPSGLRSLLAANYGGLAELTAWSCQSWECFSACVLSHSPASPSDHDKHVRFLVRAMLAADLSVEQHIVDAALSRPVRETAAEVADDGGEEEPAPERPLVPDVIRTRPWDGPEALGGWSPAHALQHLMAHVYDPDHMPHGSGAERDLMRLAATLKRMGPR